MKAILLLTNISFCCFLTIALENDRPTSSHPFNHAESEAFDDTESEPYRHTHRVRCHHQQTHSFADDNAFYPNHFHSYGYPDGPRPHDHGDFGPANRVARPSDQQGGSVLAPIGLILALLMMIGHVPFRFLLLAALIGLVVLYPGSTHSSSPAVRDHAWNGSHDAHASIDSSSGRYYDDVDQSAHWAAHEDALRSDHEPFPHADAFSSTTMQWETPLTFAEERLYMETALNQSAEEAALKQSAEEFAGFTKKTGSNHDATASHGPHQPERGRSHIDASLPKTQEKSSHDADSKSEVHAKQPSCKGSDSRKSKKSHRGSKKDSEVVARRRTISRPSSEKEGPSPVNHNPHQGKPHTIFVDPVSSKLQKSVWKTTDDCTGDPATNSADFETESRARNSLNDHTSSKHKAGIFNLKKSSCFKPEADADDASASCQLAPDWKLIIPGDLLKKFLSHRRYETTGDGACVEVEISGYLLGFKDNDKREAHVTEVYMTAQSGSADRTESFNELDYCNYSLSNNLQTLGWIHTHPTHGSFLSSIDLHTQRSSQLLEDCAVAMVYSGTENKLEAFRLNENGMKVLGACKEPASEFHEHPGAGPLYDRIEYKVDFNRKALVTSSIKNN